MSDSNDTSEDGSASDQERRITRFDRDSSEVAPKKLADGFHETTRWQALTRWAHSIAAEWREWARGRWFQLVGSGTLLSLMAVPAVLIVLAGYRAWVEGWLIVSNPFPGPDLETVTTVAFYSQVDPGIPVLYASLGAVMAGSVLLITGLAGSPKLRQGWERVPTTRISGLATDGEVETTIGTDESVAVQSHLNASMGRSIATADASFPDLQAGLQRASTEYADSERVAIGYVTITPDWQANMVMKPGTELDHSTEVFGERATRTLRESQAPLAGFEVRFNPIELSNKRIDAWRKRTDHGETRELLDAARVSDGQFTVTVVAVAVGPASNATVKTLLQDAQSQFTQTPGVSATAHTDSTDIASLRESPPTLLHPNAVWDDHRSMITRLDTKRTPVILKEGLVDFLPSETDKETGGLGDTGHESDYPTDPSDLDSEFLRGDD